MEITTVKNIIKKYIPGHTEFIRRAEVAERYYRNKTDILFPTKAELDEKESQTIRKADNRIPFNFHGLLVNQKAAYLFTSPPLFDLGDKQENRKLTAFLGDQYPKVCKDLCVNASNTSIAWLHLWYEKAQKKYEYAVVPSAQIIPVWSDSLKRKLQGVLRFYRDIDSDGKEIDVYEYWNDKVCSAYKKEADSTVDDGLMAYNAYSVVDEYGGVSNKNEFEHGIGEVPFFPFFNNNIDTGDLDNIKPLIDAYCKVFSGFVNDLEDIQEVILILTNYGGADLREFMSDLKEYKAIKIDSEEDGDKSGVSTLTIELPVEARKELLQIARKCIFEQGQGIDPDPQNFGNSSGVALSFLYSLLELKGGLQETEFKMSFGRFIRCVCRLLNIKIRDDIITQTWTRTSVKNDAEEATIATQSKGLIADEDIVRKHPWVEDFERSWDLLQKQRQQEDQELSDMFPEDQAGSE